MLHGGQEEKDQIIGIFQNNAELLKNASPSRMIALNNVSRLDPKHSSKPITGDLFICALEAAYAAKEAEQESQEVKTDFYLAPPFIPSIKSVKRANSVGNIKKLLTSRRLTPLDALDECLSFSFGQHGPHSFKYMLLCKLFDLQLTTDREIAKQTVADYIYAVKERIEQINADYAVKINDFLSNKFSAIPQEDFLRILKNVPENDDESESEQSEKKSQPSEEGRSLQAFVDWGVQLATEQRQRAREGMLARIARSVDSGDFSQLEALYRALTLSIGGKGPHSAKFTLICRLLEHCGLLGEFNLDKESIDYNLAKTIVEGFIAKIESITAEQQSLLDKAKTAYVEKAVTDQLNKISAATFGATCDLLLEEKKEKDSERQPLAVVPESLNALAVSNAALSILGKSKSTVVSLKNSKRKELVDAIKKDLQDGKITVLEAINECLIMPVGQKNAHAFKYRLLKALFMLDDERDEKAVEMVDCFMSVLNTMLSQQRDQQRQERMKIVRERLKAKLETLSAANLAGIATICLSRKVEQNERKFSGGVAGVFEPLAGLTELEAKKVMSASWDAAREGVAKIKNSDRQRLLDQILDELKHERITVLDAIQRCVNMPLGQDGEHSFRFTFMAFLLGGFTAKDSNFASDFVECFIAAVEEEQVAADLARRARAEAMVKRFLADPAWQDGVAFSSLCRQIETDRKTEMAVAEPFKDVTFLSSVAGVFSTGFKAAKSLARRMLSIDPILDKLEAGDLELLEAFRQILASEIGEQGPHSFKYHLLSQLFLRKSDDPVDLICIEESDVRSASKMIDCFVDVLNEKVQKQNAEAKSAAPQPSEPPKPSLQVQSFF